MDTSFDHRRAFSGPHFKEGGRKSDTDQSSYSIMSPPLSRLISITNQKN
jgi:hypothetical protein